MLRLPIVITFFFTILGELVSQSETDGLVKWLSIKEAQEKNKQYQRPLLIDFYTDWCGWCKHMMRTTYSNPAVAQYINTNFYPVKFDAEGKDTIEYYGKIYKPTSKEPKTPHEFAIKMMGQQLSYPTTAFVTNNYEFSLISQGYIDEKKIEPLLIFMVENVWRTTKYEEFATNFNKTFVDTNFRKKPIKMYSFKELEKLQKKKPKKVIVNITTGFCNSCRVMTKTTFVDSALAKIINEKYYFIEFNVETTDTIEFKGEKFIKSVINNFPLHSLSLKIADNRFSLLATVVLDEKLNTIDVFNFYYSAEVLKPGLTFYGYDHYKTKKWPEFIAEYNKQPAVKSK